MPGAMTRQDRWRLDDDVTLQLPQVHGGGDDPEPAPGVHYRLAAVPDEAVRAGEHGHVPWSRVPVLLLLQPRVVTRAQLLWPGEDQSRGTERGRPGAGLRKGELSDGNTL